MMQHILIVKILLGKAISNKTLKDRAYEIDRSRKYDGYQKALASMIYIFLKRKQNQDWV